MKRIKPIFVSIGFFAVLFIVSLNPVRITLGGNDFFARMIGMHNF
jgi:hypothetical protein